MSTLDPQTPGTGWVPESYDADDKPYRCKPGTIIKEQVDLRRQYADMFKDNTHFQDLVGEIYNQGQSSSCVANAVAAAYRFLSLKLDADLSDETMSNQTQLSVPSRLFIYWNARVIPYAKDGTWTDYKPKDEGCNNRNAMKGLSKFGVCPELIWPFEPVPADAKKYPYKPSYWRIANVDVSPGDPRDPDSAPYSSASGNNLVEYSRLDPDMPWDVEEQLTLEEKKAVGVVTLARLKQCLSEGYPVVFGFASDGNLGKVQWETRRRIWSLPDREESLWHEPMVGYFSNGQYTVDRHAVLAIGYDDKMGMVLCQNSWGNNWGERGYFWMSYNYIKDWEATDDFWMMRMTKSAKSQLTDRTKT